MPIRVWLAGALVVVAVLASAALLGRSVTLVGWSDAIAFTGSMLLLLPTAVTESLKWRKRRFEGKLSRTDALTKNARSSAEEAVRLLEQAIGGFNAWHARLYVLGFYLVSLGFGLGAFGVAARPG